MLRIIPTYDIERVKVMPVLTAALNSKFAHSGDVMSWCMKTMGVLLLVSVAAYLRIDVSTMCNDSKSSIRGFIILCGKCRDN